jgi:heme-degrading monooxygenase HmoA
MTEIDLMYDFRPGVDLNAYNEWAKKAIAAILKAPGIIEFRAFRNVLGSPLICATTVWQNLSDWSRFTEGGEWRKMEEELRAKFADNIQVGIWGPSPVVPEPLKPR